MDLSALLPPLTRTTYIPSPSQGGYAKVLFSCSSSAAKQQSSLLSKHIVWTKESYSFTAQPFKPLPISLQVYAATLEGDMVAQNSATETELRGKLNEVSQSSGEEREKFDSSVEASKNSRRQRGPRRYAPRVGKDIVVPVDALMPGSILTGTVTNIQSFGAFVDIGAFASGLIHASKLTDGYAKSVEDTVNVGDEVKVKVLSVNVPLNRIALKLVKEDGDLKAETLPLSLHSFQQREESSTSSGMVNTVSSGVLLEDMVVSLEALKPGANLVGKVTNIQSFGAFVDIGASASGLIHISNLTNGYVASVEDFVKVGDQVKVKVLSVDVILNRISLKLIRKDGNQMVEKLPPLSHSFQQHGRPSRLSPEKSSVKVPVRPQKGDLFTGSITKIVSSGVFVTLKQGHEGFLPASEVLSSGQSVETRSYFKVDQPLPVRVLRTTKDRITLTMREEEGTVNGTKVVIVGSEEGRATSPFEIAFRGNKVLAKFLEEREASEPV